MSINKTAVNIGTEPHEDPQTSDLNNRVMHAACPASVLLTRVWTGQKRAAYL